MKPLGNFIKILLLLMAVVPPDMVKAQITDPYTYEIDLPEESPARGLILNFYRGIFRITAGEPDATTLEIKSAILDYDRYSNAENTGDSLQNFQTADFPELDIETDSSSVRISNSAQRNIIYIEVAVPPSLSVQATTDHLGRFIISDISGNIDLNNYSGDIYLSDVAGAVSVQSTRDGSISIKFNDTPPQHAMVLTSYSGDITLSLPDGAGADLRMRTELGTIESIFPIDQTIRRNEDLIIPPGQNSRSPVNWIDTTINDGGPLFIMQSIRGNILIRRSR